MVGSKTCKMLTGLAAIVLGWAGYVFWLTANALPLAILLASTLMAMLVKGRTKSKEWFQGLGSAFRSTMECSKVLLKRLFWLSAAGLVGIWLFTQDVHTTISDILLHISGNAMTLPWSSLQWPADSTTAAVLRNMVNFTALEGLTLDEDGTIRIDGLAQLVSNVKVQALLLPIAVGLVWLVLRILSFRNIGKEEVTAYDAVLAFDSLAEFLATGEIKYLTFADSKFDALQENRVRIVAVVGLFDKGKTWLTNKLFRKNLPHGKLCTTKGLSFLWVPERRMLVLDSAGVQSTVSKKSPMVDSILDARTTESLMFDMISRISHHMIFVVNDFTWVEQEYVAMLHRKYLPGQQNKELIVVHNLRMTDQILEALELFERQITRCYEGGSSHMGRLLFTAELGESAPPVHHIGLCQEGTKAGNNFNKPNFDYLMQQLEHRHTLGSKVVLAKLLEAEFTRLIPKFVLVETAPELDKAVQELKVEYSAVPPGPEVEADGKYLPSGMMKLVLPREDAQVTMKKQGVISPLGEIIAHDVSFEPIVNVYDLRVEGGTERRIQIECPGVEADDIVWTELSNGVKVTIQKKKAIDETAVQPVEPIMQNHGTWVRSFLFDHNDGRFELRGGEDFVLEQGVLTVKLYKSLQSRRGKVGRQVTHSMPTLLTSASPSSVSGFEVIPAQKEQLEGDCGDPENLN